MTFKAVNGQKGEVPVLFLPGWGFDYRLVPLYGLFGGKSLLLPDSFLAPDFFQQDLLQALSANSVEKISIVGWSMGAQVALDFCLAHPERVSSLNLVAMRGHWPEREIEEIRQGVCEDMPQYMNGFYRKCFLGYKKEYNQFVSTLQDQYLGELTLEILLQGLDYLQNYTMPGHFPDSLPVQVLHGAKDIVAPVKERVRLAGAVDTVLGRSGHMVLLDGCDLLSLPD